MQLRPPEPRDSSGTLLRALTDGERSKWLCVALQRWLVQQLHSSGEGLAQISQNQLLSPRQAAVSCTGLVSAGNRSSQVLTLSSKDSQEQ